MKPGSFLETARDRARQASRTGGTLALTLGMLGVYLPHRKVKRMADDVDYRDAWVRAWSKGVLSCFRIHLEVIGEPPPRTGGRMIVSNHRSAIDINVVLSQFGGRMVSRHDIAGWPGLGWGAKLIGTVFVDRKDAKSGMVTIRAMRRLLEEGDTVDVFPEGTTFAGDEVHEFHPEVEDVDALRDDEPQVQRQLQPAAGEDERGQRAQAALLGGEGVGVGGHRLVVALVVVLCGPPWCGPPVSGQAP